MLWKVKGETEEELKKKKLVKKISVFHPGILLDRDNDGRFGEGLAKWLPFISKISVKDVAKAMFIIDLNFIKNIQGFGNKENYEVIENDEILKLCKEN